MHCRLFFMKLLLICFLLFRNICSRKSSSSSQYHVNISRHHIINCIKICGNIFPHKGEHYTSCSQFSKHQLWVIQRALSLANINYGLYIMPSVQQTSTMGFTSCSQFSKPQLWVIHHALSLANINYGVNSMLSVQLTSTTGYTACSQFSKHQLWIIH